MSCISTVLLYSLFSFSINIDESEIGTGWTEILQLLHSLYSVRRYAFLLVGATVLSEVSH